MELAIIAIPLKELEINYLTMFAWRRTTNQITMEQSKVEKSETQNRRSKKTRKKIATQLINMPLILLDSPLKSMYERAYHCECQMYQEGKKLVSRKCNGRTCLSCNGKRTAAYIRHFAEQLLNLNDKQFLTLTAPTVECHDVETLRHYIEAREYIWRKIYLNSVKNHKGKFDLKGMKAMEITARPDNHYHIHFHFIIEGKETALWLIKQWLMHYQNAGRKQQVVKPITSAKALLEVFKYGTKFMNKIKKKTQQGEYIEVYEKVPGHRTDMIMQALFRKKLISCFGGIRKMKSDDVNEMEVEGGLDYFDTPGRDGLKWYDDIKNWLSESTGDKFSGFIPTNEFIKAFAEI